MTKVKEGKITDLEFDDKNFNLGSIFGSKLLDDSLSRFGAGRSILVDKNNRIIGGNKTAEKFGELGNENIIIVETTGKELVVVKRTDLDLDSKETREFALADNQVSKINFVLAEEVLAETLTAEVCEAWGVKDYKEREIDLSEFSKSGDSYMNNTIRQIVLYYDIETHKQVLDKLELIGNKYGIEEDNSAVILKLIEFYES